ncbi:MAG: ABC-F family ATP-binding cassette domain-containing protein, partial [Actinomycetaceae bacterium]|nr:ABC-F family ATP-binding cassette domain-containing protein [Actinomycetaceae bacterium]
MIHAEHVRMSIGDRILLDDVTVNIDKGVRIGLVGINGAGKTTFTRLLSGQEMPESVEYSGRIIRKGRIGYLSQDTHVGDQEQIAKDRILEARDIAKTLERIRKAERDMTQLTGVKQQKAMERYVRLDQEFTNSGGWAAHAEAAHMAHALGLGEKELETPIGKLSGGQRRRVELARILFSQADTLLLDEPTNHLDHDSIEWLGEYLQNFSGGFVVISHSEQLLRDSDSMIWHADAQRHTIDIYSMGWQAYQRQIVVDNERRKKERAHALKQAQRLLDQADRMHAKASKAV